MKIYVQTTEEEAQQSEIQKLPFRFLSDMRSLYYSSDDLENDVSIPLLSWPIKENFAYRFEF